MKIALHTAGSLPWKGLLRDFWGPFQNNCNSLRDVKVSEVVDMLDEVSRLLGRDEIFSTALRIMFDSSRFPNFWTVLRNRYLEILDVKVHLRSKH